MPDRSPSLEAQAKAALERARRAVSIARDRVQDAEARAAAAQRQLAERQRITRELFAKSTGTIRWNEASNRVLSLGDESKTRSVSVETGALVGEGDLTAVMLREKAQRYRDAAALETDHQRAQGWRSLAAYCDRRAAFLDAEQRNPG
jgi:hypothetical protein